MKSLCLIVATLALAGCCKTAKTATAVFRPFACEPKQARLAADPCPPFTGERGAPGSDGPCAVALTGSIGPDGDQGLRGPDGFVLRGAPGRSGGPGPKGVGFAPPAGPKGDRGITGERGDTVIGASGPPGFSGRAGASVAGVPGGKGRQGSPGAKGRPGQISCWSIYREGSDIDIGEAAAFLKSSTTLQVKVVGDIRLREQLIQAGITPNRVVFEAGSGTPQLYLMSMPE